MMPKYDTFNPQWTDFFLPELKFSSTVTVELFLNFSSYISSILRIQMISCLISYRTVNGFILLNKVDIQYVSFITCTKH